MVPPPERGMGGNGAREERPHALYCGEGSRGPKARSERPPWPHLLSRQIPPRQITATSSKRGVDTELEERGGPVACTAGGATSIILALPHRTGCRCCSAGMRVRERSNLPRGIRSVVGWIDSRRLASEASSEDTAPKPRTVAELRTAQASLGGGIFGFPPAHPAKHVPRTSSEHNVPRWFVEFVL